MSDRTEEEEERFLKRNARRMRVNPVRLEELLRPQGFVLIYADREMGMNEIRLLRTSPREPVLFESITVKSNIHGISASVNYGFSIWPSGIDWEKARKTLAATDLGYAKNCPNLSADRQAKEFEIRLADELDSHLSRLVGETGEDVINESASARAAADRYLRELEASSDLSETLARLRSHSSDEQWERSQEYVANEFLQTYNLQNFRIIADITGLCQILFWEFPDRPIRGHRCGDSPDEMEAHYRFQIAASRLAREPGWPIHDPLVPNRRDIEEGVPWREGKPSQITELFDEFLAASGKYCECGKSMYYVRHEIVKRSNPPQANVQVRCNAGHKEQMTIDASAFA